MVKQLELLKRPRVALIEDEGEEVRVRVPREAATAIAAADPETVQRLLEVNAAQMLDQMCTKWFCWEKPPQEGLWEVTDHQTGKIRERYWFDGVAWKKSAERDANLPSIYHHDFAKTYAWRGLASMPSEGYRIPPYARHMFEKREDGKMPRFAVISNLTVIGDVTIDGKIAKPTRGRIPLED